MLKMMTDRLTIAVFGATGRTGREVLSVALKKDFLVRAIVRKCDYDLYFPRGVRTFKCDHENFQEIKNVLRGVDVVVLTFGPRPPYTEIFCEYLTRNIVKAMEQLGLKRLICQSHGLAGKYKNKSWLLRIWSGILRETSADSEGECDRIAQEEEVKSSTLDWTIIKPAKLTDKIKNKPAKARERLHLGIFSRVSRRQVARFILEEIENPKFIKKVVFLKS